MRTIAEALVQLDARRAYVVHGAHGIDELSPAGVNLVCEVENGTVREYELDPVELGVPRCDPAELAGGDPEHNARALREVFAGGNGGHRSAVLLNAAGAIAGAGPRGGSPRGARGRAQCPRRRRCARCGSMSSWHSRGAMGRFKDALEGPGLGAIAEVKRRSPSAGDLRPDADPARLAAEFAGAGAAAVSILVDERFAGSLADLRAARAATDVPLLAKGFFTEELQLLQTKMAGADAALLLLRDVNDSRAAALLAYAHELGLDVLVEAHDAEELRRAVELDAQVIGVNARDLDSFSVDRTTQLELISSAPRDRVIVAESGIHSRAQGAAAEIAGARGRARRHGR